MIATTQDVAAARRYKLRPTAGGAGTFLLFLLFGGMLCAWSLIGGMLIIIAMLGVFAFTTRILICGNCGTSLADKAVSVCPGCNAKLS